MMDWQNIGVPIDPSFKWQATSPVSPLADLFAVSVASAKQPQLAPLLIRRRWANGYVSKASRVWSELDSSDRVVFFIESPKALASAECVLELRKFGKPYYSTDYSIQIHQHIPETFQAPTVTAEVSTDVAKAATEAETLVNSMAALVIRAIGDKRP